MKIAPLNEVKNRLSTYLEMSKREDSVVTKNGRAAAVLHGVTDKDLESYLFESDPKFIARIQSAFALSLSARRGTKKGTVKRRRSSQ